MREDRIKAKESWRNGHHKVFFELCFENMVRGNGPIGRVEFVDVRQSMRNGGGPACLRLRVVMTEAQLAAANPAFLLNDAKIDALGEWVRTHYRDDLIASEFSDPAFAMEIRNAHLALTKLIQDLGSLS